MHQAPPFQILGINDHGVDIKASIVSIEDALRLAKEWAASEVQTITIVDSAGRSFAPEEFKRFHADRT